MSSSNLTEGKKEILKKQADLIGGCHLVCKQENIFIPAASAAAGAKSSWRKIRSLSMPLLLVVLVFVCGSRKENIVQIMS